jgi:hypothetical protein
MQQNVVILVGSVSAFCNMNYGCMSLIYHACTVLCCRALGPTQIIIAWSVKNEGKVPKISFNKLSKHTSINII